MIISLVGGNGIHLTGEKENRFNRIILHFLTLY